MSKNFTKIQQTIFNLTSRILANNTNIVLINKNETFPEIEYKFDSDTILNSIITDSNIKNTLFSAEIISNSTELEKRMLTCLHYFETYGLNDKELSLTNLKERLISNDLIILETISETELNKILVKKLSDRLSEWEKNWILDILEEFPDIVNLSNIKNKEILNKIYFSNLRIKKASEFIEEKNSEAWFSLANFIFTGEDIYFKNKVKDNYFTIDFDILENLFSFSEVKLAESFNRNKNLFISMKISIKDMIEEDSSEMKKTVFKNPMKTHRLQNLIKKINKISKLSKKVHKPIKMKSYLNLTNIKDIKEEEIIKSLFGLSFFKIVSLTKALKYRINSYSKDDIYKYKIRNGTTFVTNKSLKLTKKELNKRYNILIEFLVVNFKDEINNYKKLEVDTGINIALPTSQKRMIEDIPEGSYIKIKNEDVCIGVHWINRIDKNNGEEQIDLDLSFNSENFRIGWDEAYESENITYTGDLTNAPVSRGGAIEAIIFNENLINGSFSLNTFNISDFDFTFFVSKVVKYKNKKNFNLKTINEVLDSKNVLFTQTLSASGQMDFLFLKDNNLYFTIERKNNNIASPLYKNELIASEKDLEANIYLKDLVIIETCQ